MAEDLRWVLLGVGLLIILWVIWDARRAQGKKQITSNDDRKDPVFAQEGEPTSENTGDKHNQPGIQETSNQVSRSHKLSERQTALPASPELVITINLMADIDSEFAGEKLLRTLLTLGCKYGDLNIFHRTSSADGQGEHWFSVANAFQPGTFDLKTMAESTYIGLSLFMALPGPAKPTEVFEHMLRAAKTLQSELGGHLEDSEHSSLTGQSIAHYREMVLEYERHQLAHKRQ